MPRRSLPRRIRHWIANRGLRGFLTELLRRLRARTLSPYPGLDPELRAHQPHPFDRRHHVHTSGLLWGEHLQLPADAAFWATGYYAISPSSFDHALEHLHLDWPAFTFLDIGCGKGRALLLARRYPFRRIVGLELDPMLAAHATRNLATFTAPWSLPIPTEIVPVDATTYPLPPGPLLLFLYNPFAAPVMRRFLAHLTRSLAEQPRELYLLYFFPELDALIPFPRLWSHRFPLSPEDQTADLFASTQEHAIAYRS